MGWKHGEQGFAKALFRKIDFVLKHQDELGLDQSKLDAISNLKLEAKKNMIKQNADLKLLQLDIKSKMHKDSIDLQAMNGLIDQKSELEKTKEKSLAESYVKFKKLFSQSEWDKVRSLKKASWKNESMQCRKTNHFE